jgi:hypothetical protein
LGFLDNTFQREGEKKYIGGKHHLILVCSQLKTSPLTIYIHDTYQIPLNLAIYVLSPGQGISHNHIIINEVIV